MFNRIKTEKINDHIWLMNDADEGTDILLQEQKKLSLSIR